MQLLWCDSGVHLIHWLKDLSDVHHYHTRGSTSYDLYRTGTYTPRYVQISTVHTVPMYVLCTDQYSTYSTYVCTMYRSVQYIQYLCMYYVQISTVHTVLYVPTYIQTHTYLKFICREGHLSHNGYGDVLVAYLREELHHHV